MVNRILFNFRKIIGIVLLISTPAIAVEVDAQLDRDSVPAGNGAVMTLRISGSRAGQPQIPEVENLIIQPRGQSQQIQMLNGKTTLSVIYTFVVGSNTPGDYQIPAIDVKVDDQKYTTQPLKLKVLDSGVAQPPAGTAAGQGGQPPGGAEVAANDEDRFGFLTVELVVSERKHVYVGEIAPVCIRAWLPEDSRANLRSGIQPEGQAFTLHNVSNQPQQTQEIKDGKRYTVVTWFGGISATKAGKFPASLSVDATVAVRDTAALKQPRRRTGGPFDDPFFDSVFDQMNTPTIQKDVTLKSIDQEIEVRPLPMEGRPNGFTGAVGEFTFDAVEIPADWKNGEPQQVKVRLSGKGNFALMNAPELTPADAWKTYPGKDEFVAGDYASFSGSKSFQFSAVPRKGGAREAALDFSFFDPATGSYKRLTSSATKVQVIGEDILDAQPAESPAGKKPEEKKVVSLVAQQLEMSGRGSLVPLVSRPIFNKLLMLSGLLIFLGWVLGRFRARREDPVRRKAAVIEKAIHEASALAEKCAAAGDVAGFFAAARLAIQHRLGALWNQSPQAITLAEISARIPVESPVARFFLEADRQQYNRQAGSGISAQWRSLLAEALASLTPPAR
jgi:hypothetical protein